MTTLKKTLSSLIVGTFAAVVISVAGFLALQPATALAAPSDVRIGMSEQDMFNLCGQPTYYHYDDGGIEYKYFQGSLKYEFKVINGTVVDIDCDSIYDD